jgi:sugar phosphate permease
MWLPTILKNLSSAGMTSVGILSSAPYVLAVVLMLTLSFLSDKLQNRKVFIWSCLIIGSITLYVSYAAGDTNFWLSFIMLTIAGAVMFAPLGIYGYSSRNTA